jgi:hypothetical protein
VPQEVSDGGQNSSATTPSFFAASLIRSRQRSAALPRLEVRNEGRQVHSGGER